MEMPDGLLDPKIEYKAEQLESANRRVAPSKGGLCFRCRSGFVTRRERDIEYKIMCMQVMSRMPDDIAECSKFQSSGELSIWELAQIADVVDVVSKKSVGFNHEKQP